MPRRIDLAGKRGAPLCSGLVGVGYDTHIRFVEFFSLSLCTAMGWRIQNKDQILNDFAILCRSLMTGAPTLKRSDFFAAVAVFQEFMVPMKGDGNSQMRRNQS